MTEINLQLQRLQHFLATGLLRPGVRCHRVVLRNVVLWEEGGGGCASIGFGCIRVFIGACARVKNSPRQVYMVVDS